MTVNYIRHEQEFYGVMKLKSGETVLGSMIATEEDSAPGKTVSVSYTHLTLPPIYSV